MQEICSSGRMAANEEGRRLAHSQGHARAPIDVEMDSVSGPSISVLHAAGGSAAQHFAWAVRAMHLPGRDPPSCKSGRKAAG